MAQNDDPVQAHWDETRRAAADFAGQPVAVAARPPTDAEIAAYLAAQKAAG